MGHRRWALLHPDRRGAGRGYAVTDADGVRFWSEFKRLGGVQAVGYPASQRFQWDGFIVQVFQRVVFQWRPDSGQVAFVNVFDRLHDLGKDAFLLRRAAAPPPRAFDDAGKSWEQIVAEPPCGPWTPYPAIRAKYFAAVGDPIQANGLPVSDVTDMGNHYALRAQRVVLPAVEAGRALGAGRPGHGRARRRHRQGGGHPARPGRPPVHPARGGAAATYGDAERARTRRGRTWCPGPRWSCSTSPPSPPAPGTTAGSQLPNVPFGQHRIYMRNEAGTASDWRQVELNAPALTFDVQVRYPHRPRHQPQVHPGARRLRRREHGQRGHGVAPERSLPHEQPRATAVSELVYDFQNNYLRAPNVVRPGDPDRRAGRPLGPPRRRPLRHAGPGAGDPPRPRGASVPTPPVLVYDLLERAPQATWRDALQTAAGAVPSDPVTVPFGATDAATDALPGPRGFARYLTGPLLEDDGRPDRALQMRPRRVDRGLILGHYSDPIAVQPNDFFVARARVREGQAGERRPGRPLRPRHPGRSHRQRQHHHLPDRVPAGVPPPAS